jgi:hypothetical protein
MEPETPIPDDFSVANEFWMRATDIWHKYGRPLAIKEGWDLFTRSDRRLGIERIDDPTEFKELEGHTDCLFESDDAASKHVIQRAGEGSKLHLLALYLDGRIHTDKVWVGESLIEAPAEPAPTGKYKITVTVPTKIFFDVNPKELADCERENESPPTDQRIIDYIIGPAFVMEVDTESYAELNGAIFAGTAIHPDGIKIERTSL